MNYKHLIIAVVTVALFSFQCAMLNESTTGLEDTADLDNSVTIAADLTDLNDTEEPEVPDTSSEDILADLDEHTPDDDTLEAEFPEGSFVGSGNDNELLEPSDFEAAEESVGLGKRRSAGGVAFPSKYTEDIDTQYVVTSGTTGYSIELRVNVESQRIYYDSASFNLDGESYLFTKMYNYQLKNGAEETSLITDLDDDGLLNATGEDNLVQLTFLYDNGTYNSKNVSTFQIGEVLAQNMFKSNGNVRTGVITLSIADTSYEGNKMIEVYALDDADGDGTLDLAAEGETAQIRTHGWHTGDGYTTIYDMVQEAGPDGRLYSLAHSERVQHDNSVISYSTIELKRRDTVWVEQVIDADEPADGYAYVHGQTNKVKKITRFPKVTWKPRSRTVTYVETLTVAINDIRKKRDDEVSSLVGQYVWDDGSTEDISILPKDNTFDTVVVSEVILHPDASLWGGLKKKTHRYVMVPGNLKSYTDDKIFTFEMWKHFENARGNYDSLYEYFSTTEPRANDRKPKSATRIIKRYPKAEEKDSIVIEEIYTRTMNSFSRKVFSGENIWSDSSTYDKSEKVQTYRLENVKKIFSGYYNRKTKAYSDTVHHKNAEGSQRATTISTGVWRKVDKTGTSVYKHITADGDTVSAEIEAKKVSKGIQYTGVWDGDTTIFIKTPEGGRIWSKVNRDGFTVTYTRLKDTLSWVWTDDEKIRTEITRIRTETGKTKVIKTYKKRKLLSETTLNILKDRSGTGTVTEYTSEGTVVYDVVIDTKGKISVVVEEVLEAEEETEEGDGETENEA